MKDRKRRQVYQQKPRKADQVVQEGSIAQSPGLLSAGDFLSTQPLFFKAPTQSLCFDNLPACVGDFINNQQSSPSLLSLIKPRETLKISDIDSENFVYSSPKILDYDVTIKNNDNLLTSGFAKVESSFPSNLLSSPAGFDMTLHKNMASNLFDFSSVQKSPWLGEMGLKVVDDNIMLGGKSFADLEKEKRDAELQEIEGKIEAKYAEKEAERKKEAEEDRKLLKSALTLIDDLKASSARAQEKTDSGDLKGDILFNRESGEVSIAGKYVAILEPTKLNYCFFKILFDAAEDTVPYELLKVRLGRKATGKNSPNYCQSIRSGIKKHAPEIANRIVKFTTSRSEKGYKLNCKGAQKKLRK